MTDEQQAQILQTPVELTDEQFEEKYNAYVSGLHFGEDDTKNPMLRLDRERLKYAYESGAVLRKLIKEILAPKGFAGRKITLFDSYPSYSRWPIYAEPLEHILEISGSELSKFRASDNEYRAIALYCGSNDKLDKERIDSMKQSDYLFCRLEHVCDSVLSPTILRYAFHNAIPGKGKAIILMDENGIEGCKGCWELKNLREWKQQGKDIHIVTKSLYTGRLYRFL